MAECAVLCKTVLKVCIVASSGFLKVMPLNCVPWAVQVAREETSPDASFFVHRDLQRVIQEEREWRFKLWSQGELLRHARYCMNQHSCLSPCCCAWCKRPFYSSIPVPSSFFTSTHGAASIDTETVLQVALQVPTLLPTCKGQKSSQVDESRSGIVILKGLSRMATVSIGSTGG